MEAAGRRDEALSLYRAALVAIRQADAARKIVPAPRAAATGMVISARRDKPDAQSASLELCRPRRHRKRQAPDAAKSAPGPR
jgi:hypothetical protein